MGATCCLTYQWPGSGWLSGSPSELLPNILLTTCTRFPATPQIVTVKSDYDREILPPRDEDAPEMRRLSMPGFDEERRRDSVHKPALVDVTADMALVIRNISTCNLLNISTFACVVSSSRVRKLSLTTKSFGGGRRRSFDYGMVLTHWGSPPVATLRMHTCCTCPSPSSAEKRPARLLVLPPTWLPSNRTMKTWNKNGPLASSCSTSLELPRSASG